MYNVLKTHGLTTPFADAFFNADHDELNEIYTFQKKTPSPPIYGQMITWEVKNQNVESISNWVLRVAKDERIPNLASKFKSNVICPPS